MTKNILKTAVLLMTVMMTQAQALDLDKYKWRHRIVIICAKNTSAEFQKSVEPLDRLMAEIQDRDLVIIRILEGGKSYLDGDELTLDDAAALLEKYKLRNKKTVTILIGKDGAEKYRQTGVTDWQDIFRRIDAMPMRRAEMQRK